MGLKTLKDFEKSNKEGMFDEHKVRGEVFDLLKKESIKWVKEDIKVMNNSDHDSDLAKYADARIDWIKHFFNITEEDLK